MNDRPDARELLGAVERFLRAEVEPRLEGPVRFHARVAAHVLALVGRELAREDADLRAEWRRLAALLERAGPEPVEREPLRAAVRAASQELVRRIRAGEADRGAWRERVLAHLEETVAAKLAVARPPR